MTNADNTGGPAAAEPSGRALARSPESGEWVASRYADVQAILADDRFEVPAFTDPAAEPGSVSWLRSCVSRFANGAEHERRRADVISELNKLDPADLRARARARAGAELEHSGVPGDRVDVMARLARDVPMAALAEALGAAEPQQAARAVIAVAAGYFGAPDEHVARTADAGTARLLNLLEPAAGPVKIARITLLVQGCDALAGLIGAALQLLTQAAATGGAGVAAEAQATGRGGAGAADWPADAVLAEALRYLPPVRAIRRVARVTADCGTSRLPAGSVLLSSVESANRDPAVFSEPERFDPARSGPPSLTFGWGIRPCPGQAEALALAAGVIDAVRERCDLLPGQPIEYLAGSPLRIPQRLDVVLR